MHRRYLLTLASIVVGVLGSILAANIWLSYAVWASPDIPERASRWQERTRGVVLVPPAQQREYKAARLKARRDDVNTIVFGSSTVMSVTAEMFPPPLVEYNTAVDSNRTWQAVAQAREALAASPRLTTFVVSFEWSLGYVFIAPPGSIDRLPTRYPTLAERAADALTLPRLRDLAQLVGRSLSRVLSGEAPRFPGEYVCADGTRGSDFDTHSVEACSGFRYDGSATFAGMGPLDPSTGAAFVAQGGLPESLYSSHLRTGKGKPNGAVLESIAEVAVVLRRRGGRLIVLLPPLAPGLERLLESTEVGDNLRSTKAAIVRWAQVNRIDVLDAGRSEDYGCLVSEFMDLHHGLPPCYSRVMRALWRRDAARTSGHDEDPSQSENNKISER